MQVSDKYSTEQVKLPIQRKYEQMRRQWAMEQKENSEQLIEDKAKASRYRARRLRKFQNRAIMVQPKEQKFWKELSVQHITEESDDQKDKSIIIEHKIQWRSQKLDAFMNELDRRYEAKIKKDGGAVIAKKSRRIGNPSTSACPPEAPSWAVSAPSCTERRDPLSELNE